MDKIINAIRRWFCKHDFELEEANSIYLGRPVNGMVRVSATCKKCKYHYSYSKYWG